MSMTRKPKNPTNNEDGTAPATDNGGGAGEFDLKADAVPVSPSTANEVDLLQYQVKDDYQGQDVDVPSELIKVLVRTPHSQWHCFAHPTFEGRFKVLKVEFTGHLYLVIGAALQDERIQDFLQMKDIFPICTTQGGICLWPVPAPRENSSGGNSSNESAREVIEIARTKIVTIRWNGNMWTCRGVQNAEHLAFQQLCPAFFEMPWNTMLNKGFKGRIIDDPNHPILQSLYDAKAAEQITKRRR
jgi:hypothetical protein